MCVCVCRGARDFGLPVAHLLHMGFQGPEGNETEGLLDGCVSVWSVSEEEGVYCPVEYADQLLQGFKSDC